MKAGIKNKNKTFPDVQGKATKNHFVFYIESIWVCTMNTIVLIKPIVALNLIKNMALMASFQFEFFQ